MITICHEQELAVSKKTYQAAFIANRSAIQAEFPEGNGGVDIIVLVLLWARL